MSAIGSFLGIGEDVSPRLSYRVRQTARVRAVVYSTAALIVRRLLEEDQRPGIYEVEWDGRDDQGRLLPAGDYVLEVQISNETILRKRVVLSAR
jgi:flagellar hook assembly protein FlgD